MTNDEELAKKINSAIFPGIQGGPLEHVVAAKAVAFKEALDPAFKEYAANVIKNSQAMADVFLQDPISASSQAEQRTTFSLSTSLKSLKTEKWRKTCWMKSISPSTRTLFLMKPCLHLRPVGFGLVQQPSPLVVLAEKESRTVAELMIKALKNADNQEVLDEVRSQVKALTDAFPLYED